MLQNRPQTVRIDLDPLVRPLVGLAADHAVGDIVPNHSHDSAQLLYACHGVMRIQTNQGIWVVDGGGRERA